MEAKIRQDLIGTPLLPKRYGSKDVLETDKAFEISDFCPKVSGGHVYLRYSNYVAKSGNRRVVQICDWQIDVCGAFLYFELDGNMDQGILADRLASLELVKSWGINPRTLSRLIYVNQ